MSAQPPSKHPKSYYVGLREPYRPRRLRHVFVVESPPCSGKYFYDENGATGEPLFVAMMKMMGRAPNNKREGLLWFKDCGYLLMDATYQVVNKSMSNARRNQVILDDFDALVEDLLAVDPRQTAPLILVKANICRLLGPHLVEAGFNVLNNGTMVPFPASGQQNAFHRELAKFHTCNPCTKS